MSREAAVPALALDREGIAAATTLSTDEIDRLVARRKSPLPPGTPRAVPGARSDQAAFQQVKKARVVAGVES